MFQQKARFSSGRDAFGALITERHMRRLDYWGFYIAAAIFFCLGIAAAQFRRYFVFKFMQDDGFSLLAISLDILISGALVVCGWNNFRTVAQVFERGIRVRSLFRCLEIPLQGIANCRWGSGTGVTVEYDDGTDRRTGTVFSEEIYIYLLMLRNLPRDAWGQADSAPELGRLLYTYWGRWFWSKLSWAKLSLHEHGTVYGIGNKPRWACRYADVLYSTLMTRTVTTKLLGLATIAKSSYTSGLMMVLRDGRLVRTSEVRGLDGAYRRIQEMILQTRMHGRAEMA